MASTRRTVAPYIKETTNKDGVSYLVYIPRMENGKPESVTVYDVHTAYAVRDKLLKKREQLHAAERALKKKVKKNPDALTLEEWMTKWLTVIRGSVTEETYKCYESLSRNHIVPNVGHMALVEITMFDVRALRNDLDKKKARETVDKILGRVLAQALDQAVADRIIPGNPARGLPSRPRRRAPRDQGQGKSLLVEQVGRFLDCMDPWWRLMCQVQVDTGLRIGELGALQVRHLDLGRASVTVEQSLTKAGTIGPPKTSAGYRTVPMLQPATVASLRQHIKGRGLTSSDFVFTGPRGGRLNMDTFRRRKFAPAVEAAGLGDLRFEGHRVSPHWLRHSAITSWAMASGLTDMQIAAMAGHEDSRLTQAVYTHLRTADLGHARDNMAGFWAAA